MCTCVPFTWAHFLEALVVRIIMYNNDHDNDHNNIIIMITCTHYHGPIIIGNNS